MRLFKEELLKKKPEDRVEYFRGVIVYHPNLVAARDKILNLIRRPGHRIIYCVGPTSTGKTTLVDAIEKALTQEFDFSAHPGEMPVAGIEAVSPENGDYNWKDHYIRAREALNEPELGRIPATQYRRLLEQDLRQRKPKAFIIDEAQHLGKVRKREKFIDQLDFIKSLVNTTKTTHVLFGTYELLDLIRFNGQLARRSTLVHFPRYFNNAKDLTNFMGILNDLQQQMPLEVEPDLVSYYQELYAMSLGTPGLLKDMLTAALDDALKQGLKTVDIDFVAERALPNDMLMTILEENIRGEKRMANRGSLDEVKAKLGVATEEEEDANQRPRRQGKPFARKPHRLPIGLSAATQPKT